MSEMPLPMPRCVISSPSHMSRVAPAVSEITDQHHVAEVERSVDDVRAAEAGGVDAEYIADRRLSGREADGQVARVLRALLLADLALLGEPLESRHDHREELQDDRGGDVRHDPQREQREPLERSAGEEVQEAEDVEPAKFSCRASSAEASTPGAGM